MAIYVLGNGLGLFFAETRASKQENIVRAAAKSNVAIRVKIEQALVSGGGIIADLPKGCSESANSRG